MRIAFALSNANIEVTPADHSDPLKIVLFAERRMSNYDRVFCVFDRDGHSTYDPACDRIKNSIHGKKGRLVAITSWPCFEFWVLLHFTFSTRPYAASGSRSGCDEVVRELVNNHLAGYSKGYLNLFDDLLPKLEAAISRAQQVQTHNRATGSSNPSTNLHELVTYLRDLKKI